MITTLKNMRTGFITGVREKDRSFLGILLICLLCVPLMLAVNAKATGIQLTAASLVDLGSVLWGSLAFFGYMIAVKSLHVFHIREGAAEKAQKLLRQFDGIVMIVMVGLVVSLIIT